MTYVFKLESGEYFYLSIVSNGSGNLLCLAAKTQGKGRYIKNPPGRWRIRKDPQASAHGSQPEHYHCERESDGLEIVITASGHGIHDTKKGEKIPRVLGDFLIDELGVDVKKKDGGGGYVIRLIGGSPWPDVWPYVISPENLTLLLNMHASPIDMDDFEQMR